jgi:hypothetical protein
VDVDQEVVAAEVVNGGAEGAVAHQKGSGRRRTDVWRYGRRGLDGRGGGRDVWTDLDGGRTLPISWKAARELE